jgi:hypothetical protein
MTELADALRRRFKTPADVMRALGLDARLLEDESAAEARRVHDLKRSKRSLGKDAIMTRFAYDNDPQERDRMLKDSLKRLCDDEEPLDPADVLEALAGAGDPEFAAELHRAAKEITNDARGARAWAADRRALRRANDVMRPRKPRRFGRDEPEPFPGRPRPGGSMDPIRGEGEDRRRYAGDMAYDRGRAETPRDRFARMFGEQAARIGEI